MLNTFTSDIPSLDDTFPENAASPFGGVPLNSLRCTISLSSASITFFLVCALLMFVAVPCSCDRCWIILFKSYPDGTYIVTNSVWRALYDSSSFTNFFRWNLWFSVSDIVLFSLLFVYKPSCFLKRLFSTFLQKPF